MKRTITILLLILFAAGLYAKGKSEGSSIMNIGGGRAGRSEVSVEERDLEMDKEIRINLRTGGSVQIEGQDHEGIEIEIIKWGESIDAAVVEIDETNRGISVFAYYPENPKAGSHAVDVKIKAPNRASLFIETVGGDTALRDMTGDFEGKTLGGTLTITRLQGDIDMETLGGDIDVRESKLDGDVRTLGGDIILHEVTGSLDTSTLGGKVVFHDSTVPGDSSPVKIDTLGGNIEIDEALSGIKATTLGGNINIARAAVFVDADTLGGNIEIDEIDGWVKAKTLGGKVSVTMTGDPADGKRDATLSSLGGDIMLTVPAGLEMDIEIVLELTENARRKYSIVSDFDIDIEEREVADRGSKNNVRVITTGRGVTGRGTHRITLSTINGNIYLREGR